MKPLRLALVLSLLPAAVLAAPDGNFDGDQAKKLSIEKMIAHPSAGRALEADPRLWIVAPAGDSKARSIIADAGVSIEEVKGGKIGGICTPKALQALREQKIPVDAIPLAQRFRPEDFPARDSVYHNYDRTLAELDRLASMGKGLVSVFTIGQSLQGKEIKALRLNATESGEAPSAKPGIVFMGTHHAREHLSTEVPLLLAKYLIENRDKPEIAELLSTRDIYIIPLVNPDGVEWDIRNGAYHMHRKNLRDNGLGQYAVGVDLNRNYGFHWGEGGASPDPQAETYRGPGPFSEPETRVIKAFVEGHANLKILLSYHTFSELILYPWGHTDAPLDDTKALAAYQNMAQAMAQMTGYTPEQSSQLYIASGDTTDWAWGTRKIFSFTFELTPKSMWGGGFYPGAGAVQTTFQNNIQPALYLIGLADNPYRAAPSTQESAQMSTKNATGGL